LWVTKSVAVKPCKQTATPSSLGWGCPSPLEIAHTSRESPRQFGIASSLGFQKVIQITDRGLPLEPHIPKQRLTRSSRTSYLAHAVMSILKAKFFGSTQRKVGLAKGDKPAKNRTQPSGTPGSTAYPSHEQTSSPQAGPSLPTPHTNATPPVTTFYSPPTTVFPTSAQRSSSREQASSQQARTSLQPLRTSTKDTAPPPVPTFDSAPTAMFAVSVPSQDGSRRLNCLIEGESIVFVVTAGHDWMVSDLNEDVQRKRAMSILKDVDPHKLELWKVSVINES
jgi:hypothetical protein